MNPNQPIQTNPIPPQPIAPQTTNAPIAKPHKSIKPLLFSILIFAIGGAIGFGAGYYIQQINSKPASVAKVAPANTPSNDPAAGYRGGTNGVKLLEPVDTAVSQTLDFLALNYKQNKAYPDRATALMFQNWGRYGYSQMEAGPSLKCPADNGYFSYTGYANPKTNIVDNFELYYCDNSALIKKTQTDL